MTKPKHCPPGSIWDSDRKACVTSGRNADGSCALGYKWDPSTKRCKRMYSHLTSKSTTQIAYGRTVLPLPILIENKLMPLSGMSAAEAIGGGKVTVGTAHFGRDSGSAKPRYRIAKKKK